MFRDKPLCRNSEISLWFVLLVESTKIPFVVFCFHVLFTPLLLTTNPGSCVGQPIAQFSILLLYFTIVNLDLFRFATKVSPNDMIARVAALGFKLSPFGLRNFQEPIKKPLVFLGDFLVNFDTSPRILPLVLVEMFSIKGQTCPWPWDDGFRIQEVKIVLRFVLEVQELLCSIDVH